MPGLPKSLFYILVRPGGKPLGYRKKGGGTYTSEKNARAQHKHLREYGSKVELYVAKVVWERVDFDEPQEGQDPLW